MASKTVVSFFILHFCLAVQAVAPSNEPNGQKLCFETSENDMAWPITDPNNVLHGPVHGIHCQELVEKCSMNPPKNLQEQMHFEHCKRFLEVMFESLRNEPSVYVISSTMCGHILNENKRKKRNFRQGFKAYNYFHYRKKRSIPNDADVGHGKSIMNLKNELYSKIKQTSTNQLELFYLIGGSNFGEILWKTFINDTSLTTAERNYYSSLESVPTVRLGTLGVVCNHKGNVKSAKLALESAINGTASIPISPMALHFITN